MLKKDYTAKLLNLEDVIITKVENISEEVRAENCSDFSHTVQSCGRIVHKFYGII